MSICSSISRWESACLNKSLHTSWFNSANLSWLPGIAILVLYESFLNQFKKSNVSESISTQIHTDYIFDTNFFTQNLKTFNCLAFLSDGTKIVRPSLIELIPYFKQPENETKSKSDLKII